MANQSPNKLKRVVIKEELVALTGGFMEALILNQFIYWSERTKDFDKFIKEEQARDPEVKVDLTCGWIYKSMEELGEELMTGMAPSTIGRYLEKLVDAQFLDRRHNPKYKWDRTWQYRPNILKIQADLQRIGYALDAYPLVIEPSCKMQDREQQTARALPEITSEITTESTRAKARPAIPSSQSQVPKPQIQVYHMVDQDDHMITCSTCGVSVDAHELKRSAAQCACGQPFLIYGPQEQKYRLPPQSFRKKAEASPWLCAVEAFCERAGMAWAKVPPRNRGQWAREIGEIVGDAATPEEAAAAILSLEIFDVEHLTSPYQTRFSEPLVYALTHDPNHCPASPSSTPMPAGWTKAELEAIIEQKKKGV